MFAGEPTNRHLCSALKAQIGYNNLINKMPEC